MSDLLGIDIWRVATHVANTTVAYSCALTTAVASNILEGISNTVDLLDAALTPDVAVRVVGEPNLAVSAIVTAGRTTHTIYKYILDLSSPEYRQFLAREWSISLTSAAPAICFGYASLLSIAHQNVLVTSACGSLTVISVVLWRSYHSGRASWLTAETERVLRAELSYKLSRSAHYENHSALRHDFQKRSLPARQSNSTNPHAVSAGDRSVGDNFIHSFCAANGFDVYSISKSPKDVWNGVPGTRSFYHEKDLRMKYTYEERPSTPHFTKLIDVDYYVSIDDIHESLCASRGLVFYSLHPENLAVSEHERTLITYSNGEIVETHAGSAPYASKIWDWDRDYVTFSKPTLLGILNPWSTNEFMHCYIERRRVAPNRFVTLVLPVLRGSTWTCMYWSVIGLTQPLVRWRPAHYNGVNLLFTPTDVILASDGSLIQHTLTQKQFNELVSLSAKEISPPAVQRVTSSTDTCYALTAVLQRFDGYIPSQPKIQFPDTTSRNPRTYKFEYLDEFDHKVKTKGQNIMRPIVDGAFVPASCPSSDKTCINGRLYALQNPGFVPKPHYYKYAKEFADLVTCAAPHKLHPFTVQQVLEHAKPTQRKKYEHGAFERTALTNKAFQKAEAYPDIKDPRNISAVDPKHVFNLLRYVLPFVTHLKEHTHWYAFGKHPRVLARLVLDTMMDNYGVLGEGDFNRYDGTQTSFSVDVTTMGMLDAFDPAYHDEIRSLRYEISYCVMVTENKIKYNTFDSMKSGSADTSEANTYNHGFAQYSHFRNIGFNKNNAYQRIGICAGDDGLLRTTDPRNYEQTCKDLHLSLKFTVRAPGDPVSFLGRIWPNHGDERSFFDPLRCLSKLHYSDNSDRNMDLDVLIWRKCAGYAVTDSGNFIGHIVASYLEFTQSGKTEVVERREWLKDILPENTRMTTSELYATLIEKGSVFPTFISDPETLRMPDGRLDPCFVHFVNQLKLPPAIVVEWYNKFMTREFMEDYETLKKIEPTPPPNTPVTVDGRTIGPTALPNAPVISTTVERPICQRFFRKKDCPRRDKCKYSHDLAGICQDNLNGKCTRPSCKFKHVGLSAAV